MLDSSNNLQIKSMESRKPTNTGLPDNLTSVENLSGFSMDDVWVHYNSAKPEPPQAQSYLQNRDIDISPELEKHLHLEAWHVVEQGRVEPPIQLQGIDINDDAYLEREADIITEE